MPDGLKTLVTQADKTPALDDDSTVKRTHRLDLFGILSLNRHYNGVSFQHSPERQSEWVGGLKEIWDITKDGQELGLNVDFKLAGDGHVIEEEMHSGRKVLAGLDDPVGFMDLVSMMAREFSRQSGADEVSVKTVTEPEDRIEVDETPFMVSTIHPRGFRWAKDKPSRDIAAPVGDWLLVGDHSQMQFPAIYPTDDDQPNLSIIATPN